MSDQALTILSKIKRPGGTTVDLPGGPYHFKANADGDHVCDVSDTDDIATLLGIKEGYAIYRPAKPAEPKAPVAPKPDVAPVLQPEPKRGGRKAAQVAEAAPKPLGLPPDNADLSTLDRDALVEVFKAEVGRDPSEHADSEVLIAQIMAKREESAAG